MARFFFDITRDGQVFSDTEGTELLDVETARAEAVATLCQLAKDASPQIIGMQLIANVRSEAGQMLLVVLLSVAVEQKLS